MNYQKLINSNIKILRQMNNLTQEEFAEKINISVQGLSNIERNRYQPNSETIDKICKEFDITPIELLALENKTSKDIIKNITALLSQCPPKKLKKLYNVICMLVNF